LPCQNYATRAILLVLQGRGRVVGELGTKYALA
jgi:hypothetical protein